MYILGLTCYCHDSSACLIKDGTVIAAAQEERFNRDKYSSDFPKSAINYCFKEADITPADIDCIVFYEKLYLKFERNIINHVKSYPFSLKNFLESMPNWLKDRLILPLIIREELSYNGPVYFVKHHLSHAGSAFFASPFKNAAIVTVDGIGEWTTTTIGVGEGNQIKVLQELHYPNSLGFLYSIFTTFLGFRVFSGEGKVMALAEFGSIKYEKVIKKLLDIKKDGSFKLNLKYFNLNKGSKMYNRNFKKLFGEPRVEGDLIERRHQDIAASLQKVIEEILLNIVNHAYQLTKKENLCLAGGVFLNVTANTRIVKESPFKKVFIQPAASDSGTALGAALYAYYNLLDNKKRNYEMKNVFLGPSFKDKQIERLLINSEVKYQRLNDAELIKYTARKIVDNKIVGWFQGRMELGPRALGSRSILANPLNPKMKDILNEKVKHREPFRPFAVSVLRENSEEYFDLETDSPFMLLTGKVREDKKKFIPSALHINGTSRIQTVTEEQNGLYYDLIEEFKEITGVPMIINTSFNDNNEPIVCTPEEALNCFLNTGIDILSIGNYIVEK